ncbi:MAG: phytanoyl-CoA dioxygenase family protein [Gammaproteobacteria bacterium]|nr:phytanoyl-CoA dioxygenase family protein [Gammaproteobacteria bacterium]
MASADIATQYEQLGFVYQPAFLDQQELKQLRRITARFHQHWLQENQNFYRQRAINSAYLTHAGRMSDEDLHAMFTIIGSAKMALVVEPLLPDGAAFMNTQLFFDPHNPQQKNYWHRDTQYLCSPEEEQAQLGSTRVLHYRLALYDEPGIELIPGSHNQWDSPEELDVRLARNGRESYHDLPRGQQIPLNAGDLLIFDASMMHRGLYGNNRFALDVLFCEVREDLLQHVDANCLPGEAILSEIDYPAPFEASLNALRQTP